MLEFGLDFWDYATFVVLFFLGTAALVSLIWLAGLPGRIAIARNHPDAEAVKMMGYAGFLAAVPWINTFIWAFKPTNIVDIRRYPKAEAEAIAEEIARLRGQTSTTRLRKTDPPGKSPSPEKLRAIGHGTWVRIAVCVRLRHLACFLQV